MLFEGDSRRRSVVLLGAGALLFFVMLGGLGLIAGAAIFALGKPLRNAMGRKV